MQERWTTFLSASSGKKRSNAVDCLFDFIERSVNVTDIAFEFEQCHTYSFER
jgi:hypothetical protein